MNDFESKNFSDLANTKLGKAIWEFLNSDAIVLCMKTTSYLQRPAVEGIQPFLLEKFSEEIRNDRIKQMVGKMIKQIMESQGYILERSGIRTRVNELFTSGSQYKKHG